MKKNTKAHFRKIFSGSLAIVLAASGVFCAAIRIAGSGISPSFDILAAETAMPTGAAVYTDASSLPLPEASSENTDNSSDEAESSQLSSDAENTAEKLPSDNSDITPESSQKKTSSNEFEASQPTKEELEKYKQDHNNEEQFPVYEFNTTLGNESYKNIQIKNTSSTDIDIEAELKGKLGFRLEDTSEPQVLIYHTHTSESFLKYDTGYFYESYYPRSSDRSENVCAVGEEIAKQLNNAGIVTIHDMTVHDDPSYSGAYYRSLDTINNYLEKYPTIKVVLDIHRDGIGNDESKSKPVFTANGRQAAQVMILAGYNYDNDEEFQDWEYNLRFALRIQDAASKKYPEMMRPLYFSDFMYNMNVNTGSLLIEIGSESNSVEEVRYSGYLLGQILSDVLLE